jgi:cysteinyl-tRNA synthetase
MEYTDESIQAAKNGLEHLHNQVRQVAGAGRDPPQAVHSEFREKFLTAINDDLNMPRAMATIQEMLKSDIPGTEKHATILDFDRVLGLSLDQVDKSQELPAEVQALVDARRRARASKDWAGADRLRDEILALGYTVKDTRDGVKLIKT